MYNISYNLIININISDEEEYTLLIPTLMTFNYASALSGNDFNSTDNSVPFIINNTKYGVSQEITHNKSITFEVNGVTNLSNNEDFIHKRYYLSLATTYSENLSYDYKHQGSVFHVYKSGNTSVQLLLELVTTNQGPEIYDYFEESIVIDTTITDDGWQLIEATILDSGDI